MKSVINTTRSISSTWTSMVLRDWAPAIAAFAIIMSSGFYANSLFSTAMSQTFRSF